MIFLGINLLINFNAHQVILLLNKLHANYVKEQESKAPAGQLEQQDPPQRKPNFLERKRFVNYEENNDSDNEKNKELQKKEKSKVV